MEQAIDVELYRIDAHSIIHDNIDYVLCNNAIFRLDAFSVYYRRFPLRCISSSITLSLFLDWAAQWIDISFLGFLENGNIEALESYQYELGSNFLYQLHGIHDVYTYLSTFFLSNSIPLLATAYDKQTNV